jgi:hypothetical protein
VYRALGDRASEAQAIIEFLDRYGHSPAAESMQARLTELRALNTLPPSSRRVEAP